MQQGFTDNVLTTPPRGDSSRYFLHYWQMVIVVGQQMESIGLAHIVLLSNQRQRAVNKNAHASDHTSHRVRPWMLTLS